jgi:hypothetical protein
VLPPGDEARGEGLGRAGLSGQLRGSAATGYRGNYSGRLNNASSRPSACKNGPRIGWFTRTENAELRSCGHRQSSLLAHY